MFRSDAKGVNANRVPKADSSITNVDSITISVISRIEKELEPHDLVSMVFLLYDAHDVALERLLLFERVSKDIAEKGLNLLVDWAHKAQLRSTYRHEFLEALAICQLFNIIRKLGFKVSTIKNYYLPQNIQTTDHINPMKKALYKLCENITDDYFRKLKNTLKTYDIDTTEHKYCEIVFLKLMCNKFITVTNLMDIREVPGHNFQIGKLAKIIENFPGLKMFATDLREIEKKHNIGPAHSTPVSTSTPSSKTKMDDPKEEKEEEKFTANAFDDLYKYLNQLNMEETPVKNLKADAKMLDKEAYTIKNPKRIGVCYVINQEEFHLSKENIENNTVTNQLDTRHGSNRDKIVLEKTMASLNFEVISHRNLDHKKMMEFIKNIVQYRVHHDDSIFMLCILSHGVRGHVYAADSIKIKIQDIQNLLDDGFQERQLYDIPKIMILQACQVNNDEPLPSLVADAPLNHYYMRKSHFLIYWATAPELEAYRDEKKGSIFIQILCYVIQKHARREHLYDIFTKVTDGVARLCTKLERDQIPIFESTLRKKLYLQIPE